MFDTNYENISTGAGSNLSPSFFNIDNDADYDLFCGISDGSLRFYKNVGDVSNADFPAGEANWLGIDVGDCAAPTFGDVNSDGIKDLLIGRKDGKISYYKNEGSCGTLTVKGRKIVYLLECQKIGSLEAKDVVVQDLLPSGIDYDSFIIEPAMTHSFTEAGKLLTWNFGNLTGVYPWKITVIGSVTGEASNTVTNVASITTTPLSSDLNLANNYSSVTSHIIELISDVWVSKRHLEWGTNSPPSEAPPGGYINYKIEYGNIGLLTAQSVKIVDTLPSGTTYISSSPSGTVKTIGSITYVTWDLGSLPPDSGTYSVLLKVGVRPDLFTDTTLLNMASITTGEADYDSLNNFSTWTTLVKMPIIDLVIDKIGPATATANSNITYRLNFWNAGTQTLNNVNIYDYFGQQEMANNLIYQGVSVRTADVVIVGSSCVGSLLTITIGTITGLDLGTRTPREEEKSAIDINFGIGPFAISGTYITNVASITYTGYAGIETQLENNYDTCETFLGTPTIALHIYILPMEGTGTSKYERRYSLIIYNSGNMESGATITVTLPPDNDLDGLPILQYLIDGTTYATNTYMIGPYYDASFRRVQWIIDPQREGSHTDLSLDRGLEGNRYTIGHRYEKGTDSDKWMGLGVPLNWSNLKVFLETVKGDPISLYTINTLVGSISAARSIEFKAEIEPMPMKIIATMEISGGTNTLIDTIAPLSKNRSLRAKSQALTVRSTPHENYVAEGGFIFYRIESDTRPKLILDTRDICSRDSFPLDEPLMISTNTYLFWVKVAATETGTRIKNRVGDAETSHYLDNKPPTIDISSITGNGLISWKGTDPNLAPLAPQIPGSGICRYALYYKEENSAWKPYGSYPVSSASATFVGKNGLGYQFYLEASDIVGNMAKSQIKGLTIMMGTPATQLGDVIVWPNPYRLDKHKAYGINFGGYSDRARNLTVDAKIRIFNIKGELVKEDESLHTNGHWRWMNPENEVASGVYIYLITAGDKKDIGKLAIIK
jgi:uncharacterized repeat protein (TIGR01451 family)